MTFLVPEYFWIKLFKSDISSCNKDDFRRRYLIEKINGHPAPGLGRQSHTLGNAKQSVKCWYKSRIDIQFQGNIQVILDYLVTNNSIGGKSCTHVGMPLFVFTPCNLTDMQCARFTVMVAVSGVCELSWTFLISLYKRFRN